MLIVLALAMNDGSTDPVTGVSAHRDLAGSSRKQPVENAIAPNSWWRSTSGEAEKRSSAAFQGLQHTAEVLHTALLPLFRCIAARLSQTWLGCPHCGYKCC